MGSEVIRNSDGTEGSYYTFFKNSPNYEVVIPARKSEHPEKIVPSHLDHLHMDRYVPMLVAYQLTDNKDATYRYFLEKVKSSLAESLVTFYPMASRIVKTTDPDHPRAFLCNDRGVPFSEVFIDEPMKTLVNVEDHKPVSFLSGLEPAGLDGFSQVQLYVEEGLPAVVIQVNRFNCGAVVIAVTWNHMTADMTSLVDFVTAWSEISRTGSTSFEPFHVRSVLNSHPDVSEAQFRATPPVVTDAEALKIQKVLQAKYKMRTLHVRKDAMVKVKREALLDHPEVSTMDCLCAHLWRGLAKIYVASGVTDITAFTTAVEGRERMQIPRQYFGNVVMSASVMGVPAADIISKPVSYAASLIRKAVRGITKDSYWNVINQMDLRNPWKTSINRTDYQLGVASWVRFGLNDLDWGFGKPIFVGINLIAQNARKGQCVILPSVLGDGYFSVFMFLDSELIDALFADPEFTSIS